MRIAILGDIHSNLEALQVVLEDIKRVGVDKYVCVGDIVGYNSNPHECLELVRSLDCETVRGNHDHYCSHDESLTGFHPLAADVVDWTRQHLEPEEREYLRSLPLVRQVEGFTIVHSTLDNPEMWGYVFDALDAEANFNYQVTSVCFYGHTHVPLAFEKADMVRGGLYQRIKLQRGRKYFINVGSVGQPRDGDPRAAYVIYDLENNEVQLHRVPYDYRITQRKVLAAGLPSRIAARLEVGR